MTPEDFVEARDLHGYVMDELVGIKENADSIREKCLRGQYPDTGDYLARMQELVFEVGDNLEGLKRLTRYDPEKELM